MLQSRANARTISAKSLYLYHHSLDGTAAAGGLYDILRTRTVFAEWAFSVASQQDVLQPDIHNTTDHTAF